MAGIFEEVQMREDAYANNPQALQQRYAQSQQLVDLLALQKVNNEQQAAARNIQAQMETNPSTVKDQLGLQALSGARSEIVSELAPGIRQRGQQMQQMAARQSMGMPSMNASNMQRMADGGIVGYAEPSLLQKAKQGLGQSMMDMGSNMQESDQIIRNAMPFITQMLGKGPALTEQERAELKATVEQDPGLIGIFGKQLENLGIYVKDMAGGGIVSFVKGGETGFPDLNKDGEVTQADILMGRGVVGKQEGGIVGYAPGGGPIGANNPFNIRDYNQDWQGQSGATRGFVDFEDEFSGVRAADKLLSNYGTQEGIDTLRGAIARFAPPNENLTEDYISFVSERTGIPSEQPIDLGDARTRRSILSAMGRMESGEDIDVAGMLANDESRFGVTTDSGLSPEQARTQDEKEQTIDAAYLRRTGRDRPKTSLLEGLRALLPKGPEYIVDPSGYIVPNPSLGRSGEELAETMRDYEAQIADIKEDIPGLSVSDRAVLAGQELIGRKNISPEETEEVQDTTVEEIIRKTPPPPKKSGLAGANIDFDMLRQQGAAAAGGTTTGQSLALAGAAAGAEQARREQVSEKRRADQERNAIYAEQVAATLAAGNQRRQSDLIEAFLTYLQTENRAQMESDVAMLAGVSSYDDLTEAEQAQFRLDAATNFVRKVAGLGGTGEIAMTPALAAALAKYSGNPRQ